MSLGGDGPADYLKDWMRPCDMIHDQDSNRLWLLHPKDGETPTPHWVDYSDLV
jgi:hypothetical protein